MSLAELIYQRLCGSSDLTERLTTFADSPAIFTPEAPEDNSRGWNRKTRYPLIEYTYDMQANEQRGSDGTLSIFLKCSNQSEVEPQEIEAEIKKSLREVLLVPEGEPPYCFSWASTEAFTMQDKNDDLVLGADIRFDMIEYPSQQTTDPDPIDALNLYVHSICPEALVIGYDRLDEIEEAKPDRPIVFCQLDTSVKADQTYTVAWMDCRIAVHVLCPESERRIKWVMQIANALSVDGEVDMLDHSPMRITRLQVNHKGDYVKTGQLFVTAHYGILKGREYGKPIISAAVRY